MDDRRGGEFSNSWLSKKALGDPSTITETDDDEVVLNDQLYEPNYDRRSPEARFKQSEFFALSQRASNA